MQNVMQFLAANPIYLVPILIVAAMMIYGILKKLIKIAAIAAIAGGLYVAIVRYLGTGTGF
tara:strand:+ start:369 stop:551 length:183 start_codon:yes stop_codon:yes gene_type:complete